MNVGDRLLEPLELVDVVGDVRFEDPFRRLEDESPAVLRWQAERDAEARAYLRRLPGYDELATSLTAHLHACDRNPPARGGDRWFRVDAEPDGSGSILRVSRRPSTEGTVLVRADDLEPGPFPSIDWIVPSPRGAMVAVGASSRGDEQSVLHVLHGVTGHPVVRPVPFVAEGHIAWLPEGGGLYCCAGSARDFERAAQRVLFVEPGRLPRELPLPARHEEHRLAVAISDDGRHLAVTGNPYAPRLLCVLDRTSKRWSRMAPLPDDAVFAGVLVRGRYVAVTTIGAPRGRLVAAEVATVDDRGTWREIVPEGTGVLRSIAAAGEDRLVLAEYLDGCARLRLVSLDGEPLQEVPLPGPGLVTTRPRDPAPPCGSLPAHVDADGLTFSFTTLEQAPVVLRHEFASGDTERLGEPPRAALQRVQRELRRCRAPDGATVRYDVVGTSRSGQPGPTLVLAYGGWNAVSTARAYPAALAPFLERGGTLVFAHPRGDGTFGADQWRAGRRARKLHTFDDLGAVADDLIARDVATPASLGFCGTSNGGLLAGVALTQRPDLFRAVVALVPLLDLARFPRDRLAETFAWEYGDPRLAEQAAWLREYSPYHRVTAGRCYPATLFVCGDSDVRCHAWHARKMVAALRAATSGDAPIHLRVLEGRGHATASVLASPALVAEWLGFLMHQLGLAAAAP